MINRQLRGDKKELSKKLSQCKANAGRIDNKLDSIARSIGSLRWYPGELTFKRDSFKSTAIYSTNYYAQNAITGMPNYFHSKNKSPKDFWEAKLS